MAFSLIILSKFTVCAVKRFMLALGGDYPVLFVLSFLIFDFSHEIFCAVQPWYLGYWAGQYDDPHRQGPVPVLR